jgi:hypothetical protein
MTERDRELVRNGLDIERMFVYNGVNSENGPVM